VVLQVHLVVNGVAKTKDAENGPDKRSTAGVLAVEEAGLDTSAGGGGCRALGELRVEVHEGVEGGTASRGEVRRSGNFRRDKATKVAADERGVHRRLQKWDREEEN